MAARRARNSSGVITSAVRPRRSGRCRRYTTAPSSRSERRLRLSGGRRRYRTRRSRAARSPAGTTTPVWTLTPLGDGAQRRVQVSRSRRLVGGELQCRPLLLAMSEPEGDLDAAGQRVRCSGCGRVVVPANGQAAAMEHPREPVRDVVGEGRDIGQRGRRRGFKALMPASPAYFQMSVMTGSVWPLAAGRLVRPKPASTVPSSEKCE